ncbi:peptide ABC transporter substrate-binding protein [Ammoniphilus sp. CFH 90114]|uniref:peptide ABC transporter substrate-binding protein n=1 Tax=Ammoniphilus sp. CFH 90114 TaxID=2493665 RepID=UPI001010009F|nr:peptide ABC transporter substrate-binding protein [Ammoniphilus sp. CFH 90114]RXT07075.1 peptide ABC transporter substrate-binding protein [Ammoniphilus sp. CFH 90114]
MKKNKRLLLGFSIASLLAGLTAGCGSQDETQPVQQSTTGTKESATNPAPSESSKEPQILKTNLHSDLTSVDPALVPDAATMSVVRANFDGLTRRDLNGQLVNSTAEHVEISSDQKTYTFTIRNSKWNNGDAVTAHDFEFAWKRALDPATAAGSADKLYYIQHAEKANKGEVPLDQVGVKALDDRTLEVKLEQPTPFFLELTADFIYFPVNKKIVTANPDWAKDPSTYVGNGPFKMEKWDHSSEVVLVKNDQYWDQQSVNLDEIRMSILTDENTALSLFEMGELNWLGAPLTFLPTEAIPTLKDTGELSMKPVAATYFYIFNTEKVPFNNKKVRQAFSYAINRQLLVDNITQTGEIPALGLVPPSLELKPGGYLKDNDTETAKRLLQEGMQELAINELPPLEILYNTAETHKKIAEAVQDQWRTTLGVEVSMVNQEWGVVLDNLAQGNFTIGRSGWSASVHDPIDFLRLFKDKNSGNNEGRWENDRYKELLTSSDLEPDKEKRKAILAEAEAIFMDEMPVIPVYYYSFPSVQKAEVKDVLVDSSAKVEFKWAYIEK